MPRLRPDEIDAEFDAVFGPEDVSLLEHVFGEPEPQGLHRQGKSYCFVCDDFYRGKCPTHG